MKEELNIAAILKKKPKQTKLYSPLYGEVFLSRLVSNDGIRVLCKGLDGSLGTDEKSFWKNGKFTLGGEVCLFPSKSMQDWEKFAWKKGDVLATKTKSLIVVFDHFNSAYDSFIAKYSYCPCQETNEDDAWDNDCGNSYKTGCFNKVSDDEAKGFIKKIEEHYGGKLNLSTLQVEQPKQEFKNGDIVYLDDGKYKFIFIFKEEKKTTIDRYVSFCLNINKLYFTGVLKNSFEAIRLATKSEKQQLFSALAKENKAWDAEKKMLVDLPKERGFKPMDWCLMRDIGERWKLCQFGFFDEKDGFDRAPYNAVGGNWYNECIPYNDQTKHLLGTSDEWKGGEG